MPLFAFYFEIAPHFLPSWPGRPWIDSIAHAGLEFTLYLRLALNYRCTFLNLCSWNCSLNWYHQAQLDFFFILARNGYYCKRFSLPLPLLENRNSVHNLSLKIVSICLYEQEVLSEYSGNAYWRLNILLSKTSTRSLFVNCKDCAYRFLTALGCCCSPSIQSVLSSS